VSYGEIEASTELERKKKEATFVVDFRFTHYDSDKDAFCVIKQMTKYYTNFDMAEEDCSTFVCLSTLNNFAAIRSVVMGGRVVALVRWDGDVRRVRTIRINKLRRNEPMVMYNCGHRVEGRAMTQKQADMLPCPSCRGCGPRNPSRFMLEP
jgi:hypothetical protein